MSFNSWITNKLPVTGAESIYELKEMLKTAGWIVKSSSDSLTYDSSNDIISSASSGANGFNNSGAWYRIASPADTFELCIQRGSSSSRHFWIKYSPSSKFTGGSPGTTTMPTAADEVDVYGATSSGNELFDSGAEATCILQGGANNSDGYGFWLAQYSFNTATPITKTAFLMEPVTNTDSLDTNTGEQNLFLAIGSSAEVLSASNVSGYNFLGYLPTWTSMGGSMIVNYLYPAFPNAGYSGNYAGIGSNPYSLKDDRCPIVFARRNIYGPTSGYKGSSTMLAWESIKRATGQTKGTKSRITFGDISLPWDGTTVPKV